MIARLLVMITQIQVLMSLPSPSAILYSCVNGSQGSAVFTCVCMVGGENIPQSLQYCRTSCWYLNPYLIHPSLSSQVNILGRKIQTLHLKEKSIDTINKYLHKKKHSTSVPFIYPNLITKRIATRQKKEPKQSCIKYWYILCANQFKCFQVFKE